MLDFSFKTLMMVWSWNSNRDWWKRWQRKISVVAAKPLVMSMVPTAKPHDNARYWIISGWAPIEDAAISPKKIQLVWPSIRASSILNFDFWPLPIIELFGRKNQQPWSLWFKVKHATSQNNKKKILILRRAQGWRKYALFATCTIDAENLLTGDNGWVFFLFIGSLRKRSGASFLLLTCIMASMVNILWHRINPVGWWPSTPPTQPYMLLRSQQFLNNKF